MMQPATVDMRAYRGGTFTQTFTLYQDAAHTQPFVLTGWTAQFINVPFNAGNGDTVTVNGPAGSITLKLSPATTQAAADGYIKYVLKLIEPSGDVDYPVKGTFIVVEPTDL